MSLCLERMSSDQYQSNHQSIYQSNHQYGRLQWLVMRAECGTILDNFNSQIEAQYAVNEFIRTHENASHPYDNHTCQRCYKDNKERLLIRHVCDLIPYQYW